MRIIVMSDTHRDFFSIQELVKKHQRADLFLHLGDGARELAEIQGLYPDFSFLGVRGNCDFGTDAPLASCFCCGDAKIFYTHGHMYNVKYGLEDLLHAGKEMEANVVLFGHTHIPLVDYRDGIHLMNPGSLGMPRKNNPSYGILDVTEQGIVCYTQRLQIC
ncbi:MAG: metallophosphoesterase [Anaerotruncus sp.]|nr:metallophosphoesterase [Anaerotruncus sp.]